MEPAELADSLLTESFTKAEIPTKTNLTVPDLNTVEHAKIVIKDQNGNVLEAGSSISYEFGDAFTVEVTGDPETDWIVTDVERLGRHLANSDHFYPVYDTRDWRDIAVTVVPRYVVMTLENELGFPVTVTYDDDRSAVDLTKVEYDRAFTITVSDLTGAILESVSLNGEALTGEGGNYSFTRPNEDFTVTVAGHSVNTYTLVVARTEGGTVTVVDGDGNTLKSGDQINEGTRVTINATPEDGYNADVILNYNRPALTLPYTCTANATHTTTDGKMIFSVKFTTEEPAFTAAESCTPEPVANRNQGSQSNRSGNGRYISSLTVTDGTTSMTVQGSSENPRPVYFDRSAESILKTEAGKTVTITSVGTGDWMNTEVYFDADNNGLTSSDKVFDNHTLKTDATADDQWACQTIGNVTATITLADNMADGLYRVRWFMNWDQNQGPCEFGQAPKGTATNDNAEQIIDFMIQVGEPVAADDKEVFILTLNQTGNGHVEAWSAVDGNTGSGIQYESGEGLYKDAPIYFIFVPDTDYICSTATVNNGGTDEAGNTDGTPSTHTVAGDVDANGVFTVDPAAIDGVEADGIDFNAPVEYYNLQGIRMNDANLAPGIYLLRQGKKVQKVYITK